MGLEKRREKINIITKRKEGEKKKEEEGGKMTDENN